MFNSYLKRIKKDIRDIQESKEDDFQINLINNNFYELIGKIKGPVDTPYENGIFYLDIKLPENFPLQAPKIKFITKIWHPNISSVTGCICLNILSKNWTPALSLQTVLVSIQVMLSMPEPNNPQDAIVAELYNNDLELFNKTAKFWTHIFALDNENQIENNKLNSINIQNELIDLKNKVNVIINLGFDEKQAIYSLSYNYWNLDFVIDDFIKNIT